MEKLKVTLPKTLTKSSATPVSISVEKLIIDDRGLTGIVTLNAPIIPLSTGNLDGFAYSMDQISVAVVANRIQGGGFGGLKACHALIGKPVRVTLIDKRNFNLFQPLL